MEVGLQFIFQNTHAGLSDADMMRKETEIALLAEEVGMDFLLLPEHHFDPNYSMMPDNLQWLAYLVVKPTASRSAPARSFCRGTKTQRASLKKSRCSK